MVVSAAKPTTDLNNRHTPGQNSCIIEYIVYIRHKYMYVRNNLFVDPPTISDHGFITCTVPYACPTSPVFTSRRVRGWKKLEKHSAFKSKENSYWENTVKSNSSNPKKLWRSVSTILGEPAKQSANLSTFSASDFLDFLEQKFESVRSDTAGSAPPSFSSTTCTFSSFSLCSQELVRKVIGGTASKSCELDPAPTFLIKEFLEILLPFLTRMCNASLQEGRLPSSQTTAIVTPALKKPSLDPSDMKNYRPISNLSFMSKVVERIVVRQLSEYFAAKNSLLPKFQSGFRRHHSTESALLRVLSDIFSATDKGEVSLLALLDVSAAFDTVDHSILLDRLSILYGISGSAFDWMQSFIVGRTQTVHYGGSVSRCAQL